MIHSIGCTNDCGRLLGNRTHTFTVIYQPCTQHYVPRATGLIKLSPCGTVNPIIFYMCYRHSYTNAYMIVSNAHNNTHTTTVHGDVIHYKETVDLR